jgi:hypothetical protein
MRRRKSRRQRLEQAIERAITLLDEIDGDPDLEPSLAGYQPYLHRDGRIECLDLEDEHDGREYDFPRPPKGYVDYEGPDPIELVIQEPDGRRLYERQG